MHTDELDDGLLTVNIAGREPFELDIYTAKLEIEEFELKHTAQRYFNRGRIQ